MTGVAIDHLLSLTLLVSVLFFSMGVYSEIINTAVVYQRNNQVALKTADLIDSMCLSPGFPQNWTQSSSDPSVFGLQQYGVGGYRLNPFALMRLLDPNSTVSLGGVTYFNISMGDGSYLFMPASEHVEYAAVSKLLGINSSYGFRLTITPTLNVSVSEVAENPLQISVVVEGLGGRLRGANVNATVFASSGQGTQPIIDVFSASEETNATGAVSFTFPTVDSSQDTYNFIAQVNLSGLIGTGFYSNVISEESLMVPIITDYENGEVMLCHLFDITNATTPPADALKYNATYYVRTPNFGFTPIELDNSTGTVEYGHSGEDFLTIPPEPGVLVISWSGVITGEGRVFRIIMMPFGMGTLGMRGLLVTYGGEPFGYEWVATELRNVTIDQIAYQAKLEAWRLHS